MMLKSTKLATLMGVVTLLSIASGAIGPDIARRRRLVSQYQPRSGGPAPARPSTRRCLPLVYRGTKKQSVPGKQETPTKVNCGECAGRSKKKRRNCKGFCKACRGSGTVTEVRAIQIANPKPGVRSRRRSTSTSRNNKPAAGKLTKSTEVPQQQSIGAPPPPPLAYNMNFKIGECVRIRGLKDRNGKKWLENVIAVVCKPHPTIPVEFGKCCVTTEVFDNTLYIPEKNLESTNFKVGERVNIQGLLWKQNSESLNGHYGIIAPVQGQLSGEFYVDVPSEYSIKEENITQVPNGAAMPKTSMKPFRDTTS